MHSALSIEFELPFNLLIILLLFPDIVVASLALGNLLLNYKYIIIFVFFSILFILFDYFRLFLSFLDAFFDIFWLILCFVSFHQLLLYLSFLFFPIWTFLGALCRWSLLLAHILHLPVILILLLGFLLIEDWLLGLLFVSLHEYLFLGLLVNRLWLISLGILLRYQIFAVLKLFQEWCET